MLIIFDDINNFFFQKLERLRCEEETKAYIIGIFSDQRFHDYNYSNQSLTLLYSEANASVDFEKFQKLADFIFFMETNFPGHLRNASKNYYHALAQMSYFKCFNLLRRKFFLYEELSDNFTTLTNETRKIIQNI